MAERKDLLGRLSDAGEDAISKVGEMPGAARITAHSARCATGWTSCSGGCAASRSVEKRLAALERKVEELARAKPKPRSTPRKQPAKKTASS